MPMLISFRWRARPALAILLLGASAVICWVTAARAYNLTDEQWSSGPIPLALSLGSAGRTLTDGNTSWDDVAKRAASDWNTHLGVVQFAPVADGGTAQQGDGKNTVAFSDTIYGDEFGDETIAVTLLHYPSRTAIGEADVLVNTQDTFDSYDGPLRQPGTPNELDLHRVLLHEFGHILGLNHPDAIHQNVTAVMNSVVSDTDQLTADDTAGIVAIYGDPNLRSVNLTAYGLAVDDGRGKIFVSTQKANGKGSLKVVDPYLAQITASVPTGAQPNVLTLSGGGEHLYLGVDGLGAVDQIDPDTLGTTQVFFLGGGPARITAADMAVLPGAPESVLVSQAGNYAGGGINSGDFAVYDHGVERPEELFADAAGSPVILADSGTSCYGFEADFRGTSNTISKLTIEAAGIAPKYVSNYVQTDRLHGGVEYSQGLLYTSSGSVIDLTQGKYETPFAEIPGYIQTFTLEVNPALHQVYYAVPRVNAAYNDSAPQVLVEDTVSHAHLGTLALPRYVDVLKIRHWGVNGLVFGLNEKRLLLLRSTVLAPGAVLGPLAVVSLGAPNRPSLDENDTLKSKLTVTRAGDNLSTPLAIYYTVTGTAVNGQDFQPLTGVITIPTGEATAKIKVVPSPGHFGTGSRSVQITLTAAAGFYRLDGLATGTVLLTSGQP